MILRYPSLFTLELLRVVSYNRSSVCSYTLRTREAKSGSECQGSKVLIHVIVVELFFILAFHKAARRIDCLSDGIVHPANRNSTSMITALARHRISSRVYCSRMSVSSPGYGGLS